MGLEPLLQQVLRALFFLSPSFHTVCIQWQLHLQTYRRQPRKENLGHLKISPFAVVCKNSLGEKEYERINTCAAILIRRNFGRGLITKLFRWYTSDYSFVIKWQLPFSHVITRWLYICLAVHIYKERMANTYLPLLATFPIISSATLSRFQCLG